MCVGHARVQYCSGQYSYRRLICPSVNIPWKHSYLCRQLMAKLGSKILALPGGGPGPDTILGLQHPVRDALHAVIVSRRAPQHCVWKVLGTTSVEYWLYYTQYSPHRDRVIRSASRTGMLGSSLPVYRPTARNFLVSPARCPGRRRRLLTALEVRVWLSGCVAVK